MDDGELLRNLWAGVVSVGGAALTFLSIRATKALDGLREDINDTKDGLEAHKLYSANTYAKETNMQESLKRIHERIDEGNKQNEENFKEIRQDIKTIIREVKK